MYEEDEEDEDNDEDDDVEPRSTITFYRLSF